MQPPTVSAGLNQTIQLPAVASLSATVTDTGGPLATPTLAWSFVSGPGSVTFGNAASATTTAQFSAAGTYVLRITAYDGEFTSFSEVTITVQAAVADDDRQYCRQQAAQEAQVAFRQRAPIES